METNNRKELAMHSPKLIRRGGLSAMLGGILGLLASPFLSVAWFATQGGAGLSANSLVTVWTEPFTRMFSPLLTFAPPETVYMTYGKVVSLVALGFMAGLVALHARQASRAGRLEKWGFGVTFAGLALSIVGLLGTLWLGSIWPGLMDIAFLAFLFPGQFLMMIGWSLFGVGTLMANVAPRLGAWLLIVGGLPGFFVITSLLGQHNSMGLMLIFLAWVVLGYSLYSEASAPAKRPASGT
jgi:hypothetical protein